MSALKIFLFGPPRIEHNHKNVDIQRRKTLGLLIYLVVTGQPHRRDSLAALFWPDNDQSGARANLRRDISRLKKSLGEEALVLEGDNVSWNPDFEIWLDIKDFQTKLDEAATHGHPAGSLCTGCSALLADSVHLYSDAFLSGFSLPDSAEFDEWQFFQAESLGRGLADALQKLVGWHAANGEFEPAISYARRWLAMDTLHEPAHQSLMRLYAWAGEQASAIRQYKECARLLRENLKLEPDAETRALYEAILEKRLPPPQGIKAEEPVTTLEPSLSGFPSDISPFIGRGEEIDAIIEKLRREDARLITIVALGGTGKTRLSLEAAKRFLKEHPTISPNGAVFFPLASVDKPDSLPYAIAKELGVFQGAQADPLSELVNFLRTRRMLLVLDNFEQLVEGASLLQELLSACPGIKMLVTSREPLHLSIEWRIDLGGLPYPQADTSDTDELESVQLFLQSAEQVKPDFVLNGDTRPLAYRLCAALAGMPLAIKLAANWLRVMSLEQIVAEVERSLDILTSQMRDIPARQRSMNAVFESTWGMLSTEEQRAFASLAVFRGGFSSEAAQQVAEVSPYLLAGLVDHGLVRFFDGSRYEVHELTRQFAASKMDKQEEARLVVRRRHSAYYLDLVVQQAPALYGQSPQSSLQTLKNNLANIQIAWDWAAMHWSLAELNPEIEPLTDFYEIAGFLVAGEGAFRSAIQRHENNAVEAIEKIALFTLCMHYALFLLFEGKITEAGEQIAGIEAMAKSLNDPISLADAYQIKGLVLHHEEKRVESVTLFREAIAIYRTLDFPRRLTYALNHMGEGLSYLQQPEEALACHEEAFQISQQTGEKRMEALSLSHMGVSYFYLSQFDQAIRHWEQAVESFEMVGDVRGIARTRNNLSYVFNRMGEYDKAMGHGEKALDIFTHIGDRLNEANTSDTLGEAYFALGEYEKARQCFEKAIHISQELQHEGSDPASYHTNLALLETALGRFEEAEQQLDLATSFKDGLGHPREVANYLSVRARLYERTGRRGRAFEALERGIALLRKAGDQTQTTELLVQKASLLLEEGKTDQAETVLDEALQNQSFESVPAAHFEAQVLSAMVYRARGQSQEADQRLKALHNASKTEAQHAALHYHLWQINGTEEHARAALGHYQDLVDKAPNIQYKERLQALQASRGKGKRVPDKEN